jgi:cytochrome c-type protein NapB
MKTVIACLITLLLPVLLLIHCAGSQKVYTEQGLVDGEPGMNLYRSGEPGETAEIEREYNIAPPVIPHDVGDFEINRQTNDCLECHLNGFEMDEGHTAKKIPASHRMNEYTSEVSPDQVINTRYNCLQCHVPQADLTKPMEQ